MPEKKQFDPVFPLQDVEIRQKKFIKEIEEPVIATDWFQITEHEFRMIVPEVGVFYAAHGEKILISPQENPTDESVELYLNGSVFGAILHQRGILPIHGSSFIYKNSGVMLCGHSGAGKSSLTTSVCLHGQATFLTDDVTPIVFHDEKPLVMPKSDRVKLWDDSLEQLSENKDELKQIRPLDEKYYLQLDKPSTNPHPLHQIVILRVDENINAPKIEDMTGAQAFSVLQKEIYRLFYLQAMPQRKARYFMQISKICNQCNIRRVTRPAGISIEVMSDFLTETILNGN